MKRLKKNQENIQTVPGLFSKIVLMKICHIIISQIPAKIDEIGQEKETQKIP